MTIPAEGIGRGLAAVVAAIAEAAERDADDHAAALGRHLVRLAALRRIAQRRTGRRRERGRDGPGRVRYAMPGGRWVMLSPRDIDAVAAEVRRQRAAWLERAG